MADYKTTLNLPKTKFPMRASLSKKEPTTLAFWEEINAYQAMIAKNTHQESFILHDGPPYANGHIHLGTAMNKILKDIIVKFKNINGTKAEYVPGWDCHGLPIELKVEQSLKGNKREMNILEIRKRCREYALKFLDIQREEFKRLGVLGKWEAPYLTMDPAYEAATAKELCRFMKQGSVVRSKKPIHWCPSCETALAEAEVEYYEHSSPSVYVSFPLSDQALIDKWPACQQKECSILIWTTTPWTLPANMAVAVHPEFKYVLVQVKDQVYILAEELLEACQQKFAWKEPVILAQTTGRELEGLKASHPFYERRAGIVLADYVTLETGTGCVHTAPGHGQEDYETGLRYGLEVLSPVNDQGCFTTDVKFFAGQHVFAANSAVIDKLQELGRLMAQEEITHSYPHCWRCKKPLIFRATTQWFISMEHNQLRQKALQAIKEKVRWLPAWGEQRIWNMIAQRPDWCISRQRSWGVPIISLICKNCGEAYFDAQWAESIVEKFKTHPRGADFWFEAPLEELVPPGLTCKKCKNQSWRRETDILDVWFDSGTSFAAVLEQRPECAFPADMYLEGSDQHRGWFHSSLLAAIGTRGEPPYRTVLTHGYVVDGEGKKMSKSIGNVIAPQEIIDKYGAEILRLWVASENYQDDQRISDNILKQLVDNYRRIRNTCRFILGNLADFDLPRDGLDWEAMLSLDRYALQLVLDKLAQLEQYYEKYELHKVMHGLHNLCVGELSSFYLDILKDRLYVQGTKSIERRSAQTALAHILNGLLKTMAPVLSFTAEEIYQYLPEGLKSQAQTIFAHAFKLPGEVPLSREEKTTWDLAAKIRAEVNKAQEPKRKQGTIGHSLDAEIIIYANTEMLTGLEKIKNHLREFLIVSQVQLSDLALAPENAYFSDELDGLAIQVNRAQGEKCARCWIISKDLGTLPEHPLVCKRCAQVLQEQGI